MEKNTFEIRPAYGDTENIKILFSEYTAMLVELEPGFQGYLDKQNYEHELEDLFSKYGLPDGRLYAAYKNNLAAGCIALKKINEHNCEMKRLYVRPQFRGQGLARSLAELVVNEAKKIGYKTMLLDTLPKLESAIRLYERMGFYRIAAYNDNPVAGSVFMRLDLGE